MCCWHSKAKSATIFFRIGQYSSQEFKLFEYLVTSRFKSYTQVHYCLKKANFMWKFAPGDYERAARAEDSSAVCSRRASAEQTQKPQHVSHAILV